MYLLDPNMNTFKEKPHASVGSQKGQKIEITHIILNDAQSTRLFLSNLIFRLDSTACSVGVRLWSFKPDPDGRIMGLGTSHLPNLNLPYIPKLSLTDGPPLPLQPAFLAWQPLIDPKLFSFPPASPLPQIHQSNPNKVWLDSPIVLASGRFCSSQPMLRLSDRMTLNPRPTNP